MEDYKTNLQDFLSTLKSSKNETETAQKIDLKIQNWKFQLELQTMLSPN
jgi:hypothetical protein